METVCVIVKITAHADKVAEMNAILKNIITPTRQEKGCLSYQLFRSNTNTTEFLFIEEWSDEASFAAHFDTLHIQRALNQATPLLVEAPIIEKYTCVA